MVEELRSELSEIELEDFEFVIRFRSRDEITSAYIKRSLETECTLGVDSIT